MPTRSEIAWAAGLLEGEGCFTRKGKNDAGTNRNIRVLCQMTDEDVVRKLRRVLGVGVVNGPYKNKSGKKLRWAFGAYGPEAYQVMRWVLPFMCSRRNKRIRFLLREYDAVKPKVYKVKHLASGRVFAVMDLTAWCKKKGLSVNGLTRTLPKTGDRRACYGWKRVA